MSLSTQLRPIDLRLECKHCGHPLIKKGAWFLTAAHFRCEGCKREVTVTYSDKVALFDKHAHLAYSKALCLAVAGTQLSSHERKRNV
jgi:transposase-like protein